ncbi:MAG TPA: hypothetical protein VGU66_09690 [Candidatus Elarobacter sp.]|nr:hypothetical protein [Candidatus Elarobacter sp.]
MEAQGAANSGSCFIHVGVHKTGTTAIQRFLAGNPEALGLAGLYYPRAGRRSADLPGHHNIASELRHSPRFDVSAGTLADAVGEIARVRPPHACLSSEKFASLHERERALISLRDAVAAIGYHPRIVVYVRAQEDYAESLYAELVKHGSTRSVWSFIGEIVERGAVAEGGTSFCFEYGQLIEDFANVFGRDAVVVRSYRDDGGAETLVHDFLSAVGVAARIPPAAIVEPTAYENLRTTTGAVIVQLYANTAAELGDGRFGDVGTGIVACDRVAASQSFMPLGRTDRERIVARFAGDNARLIRLWHVDSATLDRQGGPCDTEPARRARDLFAHAEAIRAARVSAASAGSPRAL